MITRSVFYVACFACLRAGDEILDDGEGLCIRCLRTRKVYLIRHGPPEAPG